MTRVRVAFLLAAAVSSLIGSGCSGSKSPGESPTSSTPTPASTARMHDHRPQHNGIVSMVGTHHIEATADSSGRITVWVTDLWRKPVTPAGWTGSATVQVGTVRQEVGLAPQADRFTGAAQALQGTHAALAVKLVPPGAENIESHFLVPLQVNGSGAASLPPNGCEPDRGGAGSRPQCSMKFASAINAFSVGLTDDDLLIAAEDSGITRWSISSGQFVTAFEPPSPVEVTTDETPHPIFVNSLELSPDRTRLAVAIEGRVHLYDSDKGKILAESVAGNGVIQSLTWSLDGERIFVSRFYSHGTEVWDGHKLTRMRDIALGQDPGILAVANERRLASIDDDGSLTLIDTVNGGVFGTRPGGKVAARVIQRYKDDWFFSTGDDGVLRRWPLLQGPATVVASLNKPLSAFAVDQNSGRLAVGGVGGLLQVGTETELQPLNFHDAQLFALTWINGRLISGDGGGRVAMWRGGQDAH